MSNESAAQLAYERVQLWRVEYQTRDGRTAYRYEPADRLIQVGYYTQDGKHYPLGKRKIDAILEAFGGADVSRSLKQIVGDPDKDPDLFSKLVTTERVGMKKDAPAPEWIAKYRKWEDDMVQLGKEAGLIREITW